MYPYVKNLFQRDIALDIKDDIVRALSKKTNVDDIVQDIFVQYGQSINDLDDRPYVLSALSYVLWQYDVLPDSIKNIYIEYYDEFKKLCRNNEIYEFIESSVEYIVKIIQTKNSNPLKIRKKRLYVNTWNIGDTFAWKLTSDEAIENNLFGRYLILICVGEREVYPGHICPVCKVKITPDDKIPTSKHEIDKLEYVIIGVDKLFKGTLVSDIEPNSYVNTNPALKTPSYGITTITTSKRSIPKNLEYIANYTNIIQPKIEYILEDKNDISMCFWKFFERELISDYVGFNLQKAPRYNRK